MATWCDIRKPLPITPSAIHNTYTRTQNTFTPPPQSFHFDLYKDSLTPLSRPMSNGPAKTFTQELLVMTFMTLMTCLWATHQQPTITKKWVVTGNHMCNAGLQWVCKMSELQHNIMGVQNQFSLIVEQCFCYKEVWWSSPGTHLVTNHEFQSESENASGTLCNQTVNLKTDSKTLYYSTLKFNYSPFFKVHQRLKESCILIEQQP